ncbi:efflux transporter outer membrane subunit [Trinickia diaoshuihuensis]|uniref:efflux transporter outer membrane subunit n=1 Tax=Trinickia diaoshuihuensis TaxID=2292265 RepID=UPI000E237511|nr:efflux transporter outer membrane subunit [Trinickia diaoshuihuensis]
MISLFRSIKRRGAPRVWATLLLVTAPFAGCTVGPAYTRPEIALPAGFKEDVRWRPAAHRADVPVMRANGPAEPSLSSDAWWRRWGDPVLDRLERQALEANTSLAVARANVARARALVAQTRTAQYPSVQLSAGSTQRNEPDYIYTRKKFIYYPETNVRASADVRWELDLWGKNRRAAEAAEADSAAEAATGEAIRLSVAAALAEDYLLVRDADRQLALLRAQQQAYARIAAMVQGAREQGLATADDVLRAQNAVSAAQARVAREEDARARAEHAVGALLALPPAAFSIEPVADYSVTLPDIAPVLPSALLEHRPDIAASERRVAAANARIGVAQAAYYPDFSLGASIGGESTTLADLLAAPLRVWSVGPSLALTLFDAGRNGARLSSAQADYDAAAAQYRESVVGAMREVDDALARRSADDKVAEALKQRWQRASQLEQNATLQNRLGLATELTLARRTIGVADARRRWEASVTTAAIDRISLIKSIGGDWPDTDPTIVGKSN